MSTKNLTLHNWLEADPASSNFARRSPLVGMVEMDKGDWARAFLAEELKGHVPEDVRELFGVARGALLYGWFYYPLFTLGEQQLYRVAEAAARGCYRSLGGPNDRPSFGEAVRWLVQRGAILPEDELRWTAARELRNISSHPDRQSVMTPGYVLGVLRNVAHDINRLFARVRSLSWRAP